MFINFLGNVNMQHTRPHVQVPSSPGHNPAVAFVRGSLQPTKELSCRKGVALEMHNSTTYLKSAVVLCQEAACGRFCTLRHHQPIVGYWEA